MNADPCLTAYIEPYVSPMQVKIWRRAYAVPPPPLDADDKRNAKFEDKYKHLPQEVLPATECLKDTVERGRPQYAYKSK